MINGKKIIALCASRIYDPQIYGFIKTLHETLQADNCALLIFGINSDIYWAEDMNPAETYIFDLMPYEELDCIMIMDEKIKSHRVSSRIISRAKETSVPVIIIDGSYEGTHHVNFDYEAGFEEITRHVIECHHARHPHMMAGLPNNEFSDRRIDIFKKVIAENGIPFDDSMLSYGDFWADPTRDAMREILKRDRLPDAIICANDIMAINVNDMLQEAGIRVPDQVIVSGFDGFDEVFFSTPKIATSSCDTILLAEAAGSAALKLMNHESIGDTYITPRLIPNESCGCTEHNWNALNMMASFNNNFYRHQDDTRILYDITSNMETSDTLWDMAASIHNHKTKNSLTVVDMNIFDMEENYFMTSPEKHPTPNFHIINDADYAEEHRFDRIPLPDELFYDKTVNDKESVLSGNFRDRIIELMDSGFPLVFNALDYMDHPFGFNCYFYRELVITNYSRSAIVTSAISMGIGGFVNLQYQRRLLEKVDEMYRHDSLTGLYNRLGFHKVFDAFATQEENFGTPITVIMSDLDGLKFINDNFGHAEGDRAITAVATALKDACPNGAMCARFGGDELFAVLLGDCDPQSIVPEIDRNLGRIEKEWNLPYSVAASSGFFTTTLEAGFEITKALKQADTEMYKIKTKKKA